MKRVFWRVTGLVRRVELTGSGWVRRRAGLRGIWRGWERLKGWERMAEGSG